MHNWGETEDGPELEDESTSDVVDDAMNILSEDLVRTLKANINPSAPSSEFGRDIFEECLHYIQDQQS